MQSAANSHAELPRNLKIAEFASEIRRSERTVRAWIARGLIKATRPCGGNPLIARSELERILREGQL
jgi:excisionase family DNA binding protein